MADRVAVITGSGTGIGRASALALMNDGWSVALCGRRKEMLEETAGMNIWIYDIQRDNLSRLTRNDVAPSAAVWSPDGQYIAYQAGGQGGSGVAWRRADGSGEPQKLSDQHAVQLPSSISPDGRRLASGGDAEMLCRRIGTHVFERSKFGAVIPKVIVVNDDIDATDTKQVVWAFATRCHPVAGEIHFDHEATSPLVAFLEESEKMAGRTPKVVYNCLPPEDWAGRLPKRTSFAHNYSADLQARVLSRWAEYGFEP